MSTIKVSKDGQKFFDIENTDDSVEAAKTKGYKEYLPLTKNGKDVFNVEYTEDSIKAAFDKGYKTLNQHNAENARDPKPTESNAAMAGIRGIAQGATMGFADELTARVGDTLGVRSYDKIRNSARDQDAYDREENPVASIGGNIVGGIASMVVPGVAAAKAGGAVRGIASAAGSGGIAGYGNSDAEFGSNELASDTAVGMGVGAATGVVGHALAHPVDNAKAAYNATKAYGGAAGRGFKEGFKETQDAIPGSVGTALGTANGGLRAFKEMINSRSTIKEVGDLATKARQVLKIKRIQDIDVKPQLEAFGSGKSLSNLADDEAITLAAMLDGDNPVKEYIAKTMGMGGSSVNVQKYQKLLSEPSANRLLSRDLDTYKSAKELVQPFKDAKNLMTDSRNSRFNQLQDAARKAFDGKADEVFTGIQAAKADAASLKSIPGSVRNLIEDVEGLVGSGKGTRAQKLVEGAWDEVPNAERFNRLQKARELVDSKLDWATAQGEGQAESVLRTLREDIDGVLKLDKNKLEGDELYKASKDLEADFFRGTEFRNPDGTFEVDASKIKRMLGDSDAAKRFRENKEQLEKFSSTSGLSDDFKIEANTLLMKLDKALEEADLQRGLYSIQRADGPSAGAIARLQSTLGKSGNFVSEGVTNPSGFMSGIDNFKQDLLGRTGKSLEQMNPKEQLNAAKVNIWLKNNKDAPMEQREKIWKKFGF